MVCLPPLRPARSHQGQLPEQGSQEASQSRQIMSVQKERRRRGAGHNSTCDESRTTPLLTWTCNPFLAPTSPTCSPA